MVAFLALVARWAESRTILPLVVHLFTTILAFSLRVSFLGFGFEVGCFLFQVLCGRFLCCSWRAAATLFTHVDFFMKFLFFVFQALQLLLRKFRLIYTFLWLFATTNLSAWVVCLSNPYLSLQWQADRELIRQLTRQIHKMKRVFEVDWLRRPHFLLHFVHSCWTRIFHTQHFAEA